MDDTQGWISPDAAPYQPLPAGSMPSVELLGRTPASWSREGLMMAASRSGVAPSFRATRAELGPVAPPIQMTRPADEPPGLSTPVMLGIGAVVLVGLGAVVYKLKKKR